MSKIRKGSIVWDKLKNEKTKVLSSPTKGELPDNVFEKTGKRYHPTMKGWVLVYNNEPANSYGTTHNNTPCSTRSVSLHLISYSEYLKQRAEVISLKHIPFTDEERKHSPVN